MHLNNRIWPIPGLSQPSFCPNSLTLRPLTRNDQRGTINGIAGSTAVVANASGTKVGEVRYKAWGEERPACGSPPCGTIPTTYRYTGQRWESGIGLYFYNARWYDPALGRFVQPDTVVPEPGDPQTLNRFAYVRNNPLRYNDSSGHVLEGGTTSDDPYLQSIPKPPSERYYRTKNYGWFDRSHLKTGRPAQIIQDVNSRIAEGGGIVSVEQPIGMGILSSTFRGNYMISGKASKDQAIGIALGIYMDWSIRFEAWEGSFPGPIGDDTSFAIEDLPSHYVGFYAAATGVPPTTVFWNHLGGIEGTNQAPPRGVKNGEFMPKVQAGGGWTHIPWPEAMTITPVPMGPNTWWPINVGCYSFCWGSSPPNAKDVNTLKPR